MSLPEDVECRCALGRIGVFDVVSRSASNYPATTMIDTHCHLSFPGLSNQIERILTDCEAAGVRGMITIATTSSGSLENLEIARAHFAEDRPTDWGK